MTDSDNSLDQQALAREALSWVFRLRSGEMTEDDAAELLRWRARHPAHARALSDAVKLRRRLFEAARNIVEDDKASATSRRTARGAPASIGRRALLGGAVAAAGAVALVRPPLGLWPSLVELRSDYRTRTGERRTVEVAQGLAVELNTRTSLARLDDPQAYRLQLIEGEIAVDAAHPARPVAILTAAGRAMAGHARFGVRLVDGETRITCLAGMVAVLDRGTRAARLGPGQQMTFDGRDQARVASVDPVRAEAWRRGLLVFSGQPLSEVIDEINRYRPGKIILAGSALGRFPITGTFQLARLDRAVAQIQQVAGARATSLPGGVVLLG